MLNQICVLSLLAVGSVQEEPFRAVPESQVEAMALESVLKFANLERVRLLSNGPAYRVVDVGGEWIYKFPATDQAWQNLRRQADFLRKIQSLLHFPVPNYTLNASPPYAFQKKIEGLSLTGVIYRGLSPDRKSVLVKDLTQFLLSLHTAPTSWALKGKLSSWEPTSEWSTAVSQQARTLVSDRNLVGFLDYAAAEYLVRKKPRPTLVICHGDLRPANLFIDAFSGKLTGVIGFGASMVSTSALDFDQLLDIDLDLTERVMTEYCRILNIPIFYEEVKLHRVLRLFGDLVHAYKEENAELASSLLRQIYRLRDAL